MYMSKSIEISNKLCHVHLSQKLRGFFNEESGTENYSLIEKQGRWGNLEFATKITRRNGTLDNN